MKQPHDYSRRILLCVIGMTPQLVTETLYKITVESSSKFIPTEIHLITTGEGGRSAKNALLGVRGAIGEFHHFCTDYAMDEIAFSAENIHMISGPDGLFIDDAQYSEHNTITANYITEKVRQFTEDDDCAIHLSLAGGRKTMSYYAGYALSLYGRMQDRLSHVLVAKPFLENDKFFYPPPKPNGIAVNNIHYSTDEANIILADIPFVRLRYRMPRQLLQGKAGFQETVEAIQRFAQPETIEIEMKKKELRLNGMKIKLENVDLAVYLWMCQRNINGEPPFVPDDGDFLQEYIEAYAKIVGEWSGLIDRIESRWAKWTEDQPKNWFQSRKSKLKSAITTILGARQAFPFLIQTIHFEGRVGYGITIDRDLITIR